MKKYLLALSFCLFGVVSFAQISPGEQNNLINTVKQNYSVSGMEGVNLYRTSKGYRVLIAVVTAEGMEEPSMKARRLATEFILGAESRSLNVYESHSGITSNKESLEQKIIESSKGRVSEMQALCRFVGMNGENVYAYYLVMSKTNAKRGFAGVMSMAIPGSGQFYKGNIGKGTAFLGLTAAAGAGALICESTRSAYVDKIDNLKRNISLYDTDIANMVLKEYKDDVDRWQTYRNLCCGAAGAIYLWNVIDAFFTQSAQRPVVSNKDVSLYVSPHATPNDFGASMALRF